MTDWNGEEKSKILNTTTQYNYLMKASNNRIGLEWKKKVNYLTNSAMQTLELANIFQKVSDLSKDPVQSINAVYLQVRLGTILFQT